MTVTSTGEIEWGQEFEEVSMVIGSPVRWKMLVELGREGWLSVTHLAARTGTKRPAASAHLRILREAGVVESGMGRLYCLVAALRPQPGAEFLDLGLCRLRLRPPAAGEGKERAAAPGRFDYQVS